MRCISFVAVVLFCFVTSGARNLAAEPVTSAGSEELPEASASVMDPQLLAANHYFYVEFPRRLQAIENETQRAEAELALVARRVNSFRPFTSFHQYAVTYFTDQQWQLALLAAEQRLQCLHADRAELWRQRQALAMMYLLPANR